MLIAPSAAAYYVEALHATRSAPQPASASYHTRIVSSGLKIEVASSHDQMAFALGYGSTFRPTADFDASYDVARGVHAQLEGKDTVVRIPLFNPTWAGVSDFMRYGFYGPDPAMPSPTVTPTASAFAAAEEPSTIGTVQAVNPGSYRIWDGGASTCPDGSPGHLLAMRALRDPDTHPLTSVTVDTTNTRFCRMDFRLGASSALSFTGFFELNLRSVDDYWLVTDGTADFLIRALGIRASHTHLDFTNTNFIFR